MDRCGLASDIDRPLRLTAGLVLDVEGDSPSKWSSGAFASRRPAALDSAAMTELDDSTRHALRARLRELVAVSRAGRPPAERARPEPPLGRRPDDRPARHGRARRRGPRRAAPRLGHVRPAEDAAPVPRPDVVHAGHARARPRPRQPPGRVRRRRPPIRASPSRLHVAAGERDGRLHAAAPRRAASRWPSSRCGSPPRSSRACEPGGPRRLAVRAPRPPLRHRARARRASPSSPCSPTPRPGPCWRSPTTRRACGCGWSTPDTRGRVVMAATASIAATATS